jgi:DNA-binding response OmpR family regulator
MTGEPKLDRHRILVVEDEYFLATDIVRALQGAGAEVVGPAPTEEAARAELGDARPDAVVVDINLGAGPSFKLAEDLKDQGIPFVFVTGYGREAIPDRFDDIERIEKPIALRRVVAAIARLLQAAA